MPSELISKMRKRLRRVGRLLMVVVIVLIPASRSLLTSLVSTVRAAAASNKPKDVVNAPTSQPTKASTASAKTPQATKSGDN